MPRQVTIAANNVYCKARLSGAKYNERLLTRSGASEELPGVTEDSIKKYETGITRPPNDVVALMADAYNAPELISWYCTHECPLGKNCREIPQMPPERAILRVQNASESMNEALSTYANILDDGIIDVSEEELLERAREQFVEAKRRLDELIAACDKQKKKER